VLPLPALLKHGLRLPLWAVSAAVSAACLTYGVAVLLPSFFTFCSFVVLRLEFCRSSARTRRDRVLPGAAARDINLVQPFRAWPLPLYIQARSSSAV